MSKFCASHSISESRLISVYQFHKGNHAHLPDMKLATLQKFDEYQLNLPDVSWMPDMVILDIETTGGSHLYDRITEIALVRIEDGEIVDTWQSLINPERPIPITITYFTGITDEMVKDAPTFAEIAPTLYQYLDGMILAAHNVRFDYGFLKAEYQRIEATLRLRTLCTVKLSRRIFPGHKGHGLHKYNLYKLVAEFSVSPHRWLEE